jgi:tRNA threonylcarbamoyladenosine biosynthesis protein TsaE
VPRHATLNRLKDNLVSHPKDDRYDRVQKVVLSSGADTETFGKVIGRGLRGGEVLALIGALGAGKTTLIRGIASGLQVPPASVSSPTFVFIHEYHGRLPLIHVDLYRLRAETEADSIGLDAYLTGQAVTAIEWADRFPAILPADRLEIRLIHQSPTVRKAELQAYGTEALALLTRIQQTRRLGHRRTSSQDSARTSGRRKALKR